MHAAAMASQGDQESCPCRAQGALLRGDFVGARHARDLARTSNGYATPAARRIRRIMLRSSALRSSATVRPRSEEHTSELQSLMRISYAVFCLKKKTQKH